MNVGVHDRQLGMSIKKKGNFEFLYYADTYDTSLAIYKPIISFVTFIIFNSIILKL